MSPKLLTCLVVLLAVSATHVLGGWLSDLTNLFNYAQFHCGTAQDAQVPTAFLLFNGPNENQSIDTSNTEGLDLNLDTKFIIHDYGSESDTKWVTDLAKAIKDDGAANVIVVNWTVAAGDLFNKASANTRTVGENVATFIQSVVSLGVDPKKVHLIGHGLGAHVAGFAGKIVNVAPEEKLGRITGLDPTGLCFQNKDSTGRLSRDDAEYVDVIHTAAYTITAPLTGKKIGLGSLVPMGVADFYPNGGVYQPECAQGILEKVKSVLSRGIVDTMLCNHRYATELFVNSVSSEVDYKGCRNEDVSNCTSVCEDGITMGYRASGGNGTYTLLCEE